MYRERFSNRRVRTIKKCVEVRTKVLTGDYDCILIPYTNCFDDYVDYYLKDLTPYMGEMLHFLDEEDYETCKVIKDTVDVIRGAYVVMMNRYLEEDLDWDRVLGKAMDKVVGDHVDKQRRF